MKRLTEIAVLAATVLFTSSDAKAQVPPHTFRFKSYMGRCLDFGAPLQSAGSPVFIYDCNGTVAQQVGVEEVRGVAGHRVRLRAGTLCIGMSANPPVQGTALLLRPCGDGAGQIFAWDGDSLLMDSNLDLSVQLKDGVTKNRTPLVLGARQVSDTELWDAEAVDGSATQPTTGFVNVSTADELRQVLANVGLGTVVVVTTDIDFPTLTAPFSVPAGVTIRGERRGVALGPQISLLSGPDGSGLFIMTGDHVRITGLRLRGAGRDKSTPGLKGINGNANFAVLIDHNDVSDWPLSAVDLNGDQADELVCPAVLPVRQQIVRVIRNHIHDNFHGYGVVSGSGSNPLIFGNTFQKNHHGVASDGFAFSAYSAVSNLFLSASEDTDVDMHGELGDGGASHDFGGIGGLGAEVRENTFLETGKVNFGVRGTPCSGALDTFYGNVTVRDIGAAITVVPDGKKGQGSVVSWASVEMQVPFLRVSSEFSMPNPTRAFLVGDFDGDGKDDVFMATGAGWYYSPGANAEWRFLSAKTDRLGSLLLGDFDGDGRADVFTQIGDKWMVSWGGRSDWQLLSDNHGAVVNHAIRGMLDFVIGDFVGDAKADVFYADGTTWWVSDGGTGPFTEYATSGYKRQDLLFGDFDGSGKTEVAGVVANQWMFVPANGPHQWTPLRPKLTNTMAGLIAADFDGNGKTDIAQFVNGVPVSMRVSRDGKGDWEPLNKNLTTFVAIGRFDDTPGADILVWNNNFWAALSKGSATAVRQSRQDMR